MVSFQFYIANTAVHFEEASQLIREYANSLGIDLSFQNFSAEIQDLPTIYSPPTGAMILVFNNGVAAGCAGVRQWSKDIGELKRMYVRPNHRKAGVGFALLDRCISEARRLHYNRLRLDTLAGMTSAQSLYLKKGFYEIPPYRPNPIPGTLFFELNLSS
ncbi:MAG: GNAT family N-acetyltransferase [Saprospiraceae bacterium]